MYLLVILVFFIAGMAVAGISGVAEGAGLAGGAIVFFYGAITAATAFIVSLFVANKAKPDVILSINKVLGGLLLVAICLLVYRLSRL